MSLSDKEYDEAADLFAMPGWKSLVEQWEDQLELCTIDSCTSLEDLYFSKGRAAVLRMMLNYEAYVRNIEEDGEEYGLQ